MTNRKNNLGIEVRDQNNSFMFQEYSDSNILNKTIHYF